MYQRWQKSTKLWKMQKTYSMFLHCRLRQEALVARRAMLKMFADNIKEIFEPAGKLEVEEDFESDKESETALPSTMKKVFPK